MKSTSAAANRTVKPFRLVADLWIGDPQLQQGSGTSGKGANAVRFTTVPSAPVRLVTCGFTRGYGGIHTSSRAVQMPVRYCPHRARNAPTRMTLRRHGWMSSHIAHARARNVMP
jgi:hypothetical protein